MNIQIKMRLDSAVPLRVFRCVAYLKSYFVFVCFVFNFYCVQKTTQVNPWEYFFLSLYVFISSFHVSVEVK